MDVSSNLKNKIQKLMQFLKTHYLKMGFIVSGLVVLTVYQNCSNPKPDLSQYSGSSVTPTPTPPAPLSINFTGGVSPEICTVPATATSPGGANVSFTIIGGDPLQSFAGLFSMNSETINPDGSLSTSPFGTLVSQYGQRGETAVFQIPHLEAQIVPLVTFVTISSLNPSTGMAPRLYFTFGPTHSKILVTSNSNFTVPDCADRALLTIEAWGGGGGNSGGSVLCNGGGAGGGGGGGGAGRPKCSSGDFAGDGGAGGQDGKPSIDSIANACSMLGAVGTYGYAGGIGSSNNGETGGVDNPYCFTSATGAVDARCERGGNGGGGGGIYGGSTGRSTGSHGAGGGGGYSYWNQSVATAGSTAAGNGVTPANAILIPASANFIKGNTPASNNARGGASAQAGSAGLVTISW